MIFNLSVKISASTRNVQIIIWLFFFVLVTGGFILKTKQAENKSYKEQTINKNYIKKTNDIVIFLPLLDTPVKSPFH